MLRVRSRANLKAFCRREEWRGSTEEEEGRWGQRPRNRRGALQSKRDDTLKERATDSLRALTDTGAQPLTNEDGTYILAVNGEIYNHRALRKSLKEPAVFKTHSDCEVIMHLVRPLSRLHLQPQLTSRRRDSTRSTEPPSAASSTACSPLSSLIPPSLPPA